MRLTASWLRMQGTKPSFQTLATVLSRPAKYLGLAISSLTSGDNLFAIWDSRGKRGVGWAGGSEDEARAFVATQYPNAKTTHVGGGTPPKSANQWRPWLQE